MKIKKKKKQREKGCKMFNENSLKILFAVKYSMIFPVWNTL